MRIALTALLLLAGAAPAAADGEIALRGAYYKEESTKVAQPMLDARLDVGAAGELTAHFLVDSITSASVAAGAAGQPFNERRYEGGLGYEHRLGDLRVGGSARYSNEPDYTSLFVTVRGTAALAQANTILTLSLAQGSDHATNGINQGMLGVPIEGDLDTTLASVGVSQVLTPELVGALSYDVMYLSGFQENPYRNVIAGGNEVRERVPDTRVRHAAAASLRAYVCPTRSTLLASYRLYVDDWGVLAHTPELRVVQEIVRDLDVRLRYRYYRQSGADFYREIYDSSDPAVQEFLTDDAKLGAYTTQTFGVQLLGALSVLGAGGSLGKVRGEAIVEYIRQDNRFGNAVVVELAVTVPFAY